MRSQWALQIPLRDGVEIVGDIFLPDLPAANGYPTLLVRTPYGRQSAHLIEQAEQFASRGYAVLNVDVRGRGDSDGVFVPYRNEGQDGYDAIEWAACQAWSNGRVGTIGGSYLGKVQWLAALEQPPHLCAMVPIVTPSDPFVEWPTGTPIPSHLCWLFLTSGRAVQNIDAVDWNSIYRHLPLSTMDEVLGRDIPMWREEWAHTGLDNWWMEAAYQHRMSEIALPVLHISGWYDDEQVGTPLNFSRMSTQALSEQTRSAQRLIMGPWGHRVNLSQTLGEVDFGETAVIDLVEEEARFFDRWLKEESPSDLDDKPVKIFVMGDNRWREEQAWPLERAEMKPWYLHSQGGANGANGDGVLSPIAPGSESFPTDTYIYRPDDPVPFLTEPTSSQIGGPDDYQFVHERRDLLVYTSGPRTEKLEVTGPVHVRLFASTNVRDTDFMAQLHDVRPDGYVQRICDGMVRCRFRFGLDQQHFVDESEVMELTIDCWNTSHVFLPGHRLRVHVTSSAFPKYDRNQNDGEPLGTTTKLISATQTIYHSTEYPSHILLPVIR